MLESVYIRSSLVSAFAGSVQIGAILFVCLQKRCVLCFFFACLGQLWVELSHFFYCILHVRIRLLKAWTCLILLW